MVGQPLHWPGTQGVDEELLDFRELKALFEVYSYAVILIYMK